AIRQALLRPQDALGAVVGLRRLQALEAGVAQGEGIVPVWLDRADTAGLVARYLHATMAHAQAAEGGMGASGHGCQPLVFGAAGKRRVLQSAYRPGASRRMPGFLERDIVLPIARISGLAGGHAPALVIIMAGRRGGGGICGGDLPTLQIVEIT